MPARGVCEPTAPVSGSGTHNKGAFARTLPHTRWAAASKPRATSSAMTSALLLLMAAPSHVCALLRSPKSNCCRGWWDASWSKNCTVKKKQKGLPGCFRMVSCARQSPHTLHSRCTLLRHARARARGASGVHTARCRTICVLTPPRRVCAVPGRPGRARNAKRGQAGVSIALLLPSVHVCSVVRVSLPAARAPQLPHPPRL